VKIPEAETLYEGVVMVEPGPTGNDGEDGWNGVDGMRDAGTESASQARLVELMEVFVGLQRRRPELAVRPWWTSGGRRAAREAAGFVVEYCPGGVDSVVLDVRRDRVALEGPRGHRELALGLERGWIVEGRDAVSPVTVANRLLSAADGLLSEAA
jgi:hypothetical protein